MKHYLSLLLLAAFILFGCNKSKLSGTLQQNATNNTPFTASIEFNKWTKQDRQTFLNQCIQQSDENDRLNGEVYCNCLLGVMKDKYPPDAIKQAIKENIKSSGTCLRSAFNSHT